MMKFIRSKLEIIIMNKILLLFTFLVSLSCYGKDIDTTIFDCEFEKNLFLKYTNSQEFDTVDFFIALENIDTQDRIKKTMDDNITFLKEKISSQRSISKQIKIIYNSVHSAYLKSYEVNANFSDIFFSGKYNCLSATALYALIFESLEIDYVIKSTHTHVYIIADPSDASIIVETTNPTSGVFEMNEKFKRSYVNYLYENKIILQEEYDNISIGLLFDKYFLTDLTIDLIQLAGLQYYNYSIEQMNTKDYLSALKSIEKSEILYKSDIVESQKRSIMQFIMSIEQQQKNYSYIILAKYVANDPSNLFILESALKYFRNVSVELTVKHPNIEEYDLYFNGFCSYLSDTINIDDIRQEYYIFAGRYYYFTMKYYQAICKLESAYQFNPDNIETKGMINSSVVKYLKSENSYENRIDSIDYYIAKFPFLQDDFSMQKLTLYSYMKVITPYFEYNEYNDYNQGIKQFERFETFVNKYPEFLIDDEVIGHIYGKVSAYYVRNREYDAAKETLKNGLNLAPNSAELKRRLNTIENAN